MISIVQFSIANWYTIQSIVANWVVAHKVYTKGMKIRCT